MMMRTFIMNVASAALVLALGVGINVTSLAAPTPEEVIRTTADEVLQALNARRDELKKNPQALQAMVREHASEIFDTQRIARLILARHYKSASPEQVQGFIHEFSELLIRTYATAVFEIGALDIDYLPTVYNDERTKALVKTSVRLNDNVDPVTVHYKMNVDDRSRWRVYEVTVNGISLITNYRTVYDGIIQKKGLDGLIADLAARAKAQ